MDHWIWALLIYCWIQFANICWVSLHVYSKILTCNFLFFFFFFFCGVFVWFGYQGNGAQVQWIWKCSFQLFWNNFQGMDVNSLYVLTLFNIILISLLVISLLKLFLLDSILPDCMFLEICPFLLKLPTFLAYNCSE